MSPKKPALATKQPEPKQPEPAAKKPAAPPESTKRRLERVLVWVHAENERCAHACKVPLEDVAAGTGLPLPLVVKISKHLEHHGLLEYDKGTIELTVAGMIEAEKVQAPPPGAAIV